MTSPLDQRDIEAVARMKICGKHPERPTPLIWTFAFQGAECWCPYCGYRGGMFNGCPSVKATDALRVVAAEDEARAKPFLTAVASLSCGRLLFESGWVTPADLPPEQIEAYRRTREEWKYPAILALDRSRAEREGK